MAKYGKNSSNFTRKMILHSSRMVFEGRTAADKMKTSQQMINNRYRVIANIGADKSGYFLSLQDTEDRKKYYTKLVRIDDSHLSAKALYALQMRVQRLSQFSHTNVISIYETELAPEGLLVRQTELPGMSLKNLMQKTGRPIAPQTAYSVALDIASALAALHSEGLVHGELDPCHIWIDDREKNYLSFLELPPAFDTDRPVYRMPELTSSTEPQPSADIFSFGILMLEMCTGLSAYRSSGDETDVEEYSRVYTYYRGALADSVQNAAPDLYAVISRCLTDNKEQRFKNGEELYWAIREMAEKNDKKKASEAGSENASAEQKQDRKSSGRRKGEKQPSFDTSGGKKKPSVLPFLFFGLLFIAAGVWFWYKKPEILPKAEPTAASTVTPLYQQTMNVLYVTQTSVAVDVEKKSAEVSPTATPEPTATSTPIPTATQVPRPISPEIGRVIRWNTDDALMAAVPAAVFTMGMDQTFNFDMNGVLPSHRVSQDAFWIDQTEVTQAQYARCVSEGVCQPIERIADEWISDDYPIMNVRWTDAQTYCAWAGKRLPSEAEWELAARGTDARLYPWGSDSLSVGTLPNTLHAGGADSRDLSPYGVLDMAGNVSEWVNDFYSDTRLVSENNELVNPIGPISGNMHTVKGGSFLSDDPESSRFVFSRFGAAPDLTQNFGFRCVVSAGEVSTLKAVEQSSRLETAPALNDPERPEGCTDRARFVNDVTIPDGTVVTRGEWITKTWTLENYGTCPWSENYKVVWADPNIENRQRLFDIGTALQPGEQAEISVSFPVQGEGLTHISFLLANTQGETFGMGPQQRGDLYIEYRVQ